MPPSTMDGILLLAWMEKDEALLWLRKNCWFDPELTDQQAEELWTPYRDRMLALPERNYQPVQRLAIPQAQRQLVNQFLARFRGPEVLDVININPLDLVIYQKYVVTDRCDHHATQSGAWARKFLVIDRPIANLPGRMEDGIIKFNLPHAEHLIAFQPDGAFRIQQGDGYVSVIEISGRLILKAGYHRSVALAAAAINEPDASETHALVALTRSLPPELAPNCPSQGLRATVLGTRAPVLRDFFDRDLAMEVKLRKKRWEAHLQITAVDDV
jgi:hypothetical protein